MIIPKKEKLSDEEFEEVVGILREFKCTISPIPGETRTIYAIRGDERHELMIKRLEGLPYISRVDTIQSPYKLMDIKSELANQTITVAGRALGRELLFIAGQCTIDPNNPNYFLETAQAVKEAGAHMLRGGVWKPRTSPHSYQGNTRAIDILMRAHQEIGLPVITEVMDEEQLVVALDAGVHALQIGARNALNYSLLKKIGELTAYRGTPVLLKRGMHMGSMNEFICAAEYIVAGGNANVILCPRGTVPPVDGYRNMPDESITPLLKQKTWSPIVVDPSHSVGKATYVPHAALAAISYGADGIIVETHVNARLGIGDDPKQAISPETLRELVADAQTIYELKKKYQSYLN